MAALALVGSLLAIAPTAASGQEARDIDDACPPGEVPSAGFTDTRGNFFEFEIDCIAGYGITRGTTATTYSPSDNVTRAQMASFIARELEASGMTRPSGLQDAFPDDEGNRHEANINWLASLGVVQGKQDGTYRPHERVRRDQMATFINNAVRAITGAALTSSNNYFIDDHFSTHHDNINALAEAGIVEGTGPAIYSPEGPITRQQMSGFITRSLDYLVEEGFVEPPFGPDPEPEGPDLQSASFGDTDGNGFFSGGDSVTLRFSEAVFADSAIKLCDGDGDFTWLDTDAPTGIADGRTPATVSGSGTDTLVFTAQQTVDVGGDGDGAVNGTVTICDAEGITDADGNVWDPASETGPNVIFETDPDTSGGGTGGPGGGGPGGTVPDNIPPRSDSATTDDAVDDNVLTVGDTLTIRFNETMQTLVDGARFTVTENAPGAGGDSDTIECDPASDGVAGTNFVADCAYDGSRTTLTVLLTGGGSGAVVEYDATVTGASGLRDVAGNSWDFANSADRVFDDPTPPRSTSAVTDDADGSNTLSSGDTLTIDFDERIGAPDDGDTITITEDSGPGGNTSATLECDTNGSVSSGNVPATCVKADMDTLTVTLDADPVGVVEYDATATAHSGVTDDDGNGWDIPGSPDKQFPDPTAPLSTSVTVDESGGTADNELDDGDVITLIFDERMAVPDAGDSITLEENAALAGGHSHTLVCGTNADCTRTGAGAFSSTFTVEVTLDPASQVEYDADVTANASDGFEDDDGNIWDPTDGSNPDVTVDDPTAPRSTSAETDDADADNEVSDGDTLTIEFDERMAAPDDGDTITVQENAVGGTVVIECETSGGVTSGNVAAICALTGADDDTLTFEVDGATSGIEYDATVIGHSGITDDDGNGWDIGASGDKILDDPTAPDATAFSVDDDDEDNALSAGDTLTMSFDERMGTPADGATFDLDDDADSTTHTVECDPDSDGVAGDNARATCSATGSVLTVVIVDPGTPSGSDAILEYDATVPATGATGVEDDDGNAWNPGGGDTERTFEDTVVPHSALGGFTTDDDTADDSNNVSVGDTLSMAFDERMGLPADATFELTDNDGDTMTVECNSSDAVGSNADATCTLDQTATPDDTIDVLIDVMGTIDDNGVGNGVLEYNAEVIANNADGIEDHEGNDWDEADPDNQDLVFEDPTDPISTATSVNDADGTNTLTTDDVITITFDERMRGPDDGDSFTIEDSAGAGADAATIECDVDNTVSGSNISADCDLTGRTFTVTLNDGDSDVEYDATVTGSTGFTDDDGNPWDLGNGDIVLDDVVRPLSNPAVPTDTDDSKKLDNLDELVVTFDERMAAPDAGDKFSVVDEDGDTGDIICDTNADCVLSGVNDEIITFTMTGDPENIANTGNGDGLQYPLTVQTSSGVTDDDGNEWNVGSSADKTFEDNTPPEIESAITSTDDENVILVTYDEPVDCVDSPGDPTQYKYDATGGGGTDGTADDVDCDGTDTVTVTFPALTVDDTDPDDEIRYEESGTAANRVKDDSPSANEAVDGQSVEIADGTAPTILSAITSTDDEDIIEVTFDEDVTCSGLNASQFKYDANGNGAGDENATAISCDGSPVVTVTFGGGAPDDTNAVDEIRYEQSSTAANRVKDTSAQANDAASPDSVEVLDGTAPVMVSAITSTDDEDVIEVTYDEPVDCTTAAPEQFEYDANGDSDADDGGEGPATAVSCNDTVTVTVTFGNNEPDDTNGSDKILYTEGAEDDRVKDISAQTNDAASPDEVAIDDGTSPVIVSAVTSTDDADVVEVTYDEDLDCGSVAGWAADQFWYDANGDDVQDAGDDNATGLACAGSVLTVTFPDTTVDDTSATDVIRYEESATDTERVTDAAGNEAVSPDSSAIDDGTAPTIASAAVTGPNTIVVTYSESIDCPAADDVSQWLYDADGDFTTMGDQQDVTAYTCVGTDVTLTVDGAAIDDTDPDDEVRYTEGTDPVQDTATNNAVTPEEEPVLDGVAPTMVSAATSADDADVVEVTYDEDLDCGSVAGWAADQFEYDADGTAGGDVPADSLSCAGSVLTVTFPDTTVDDTSGTDVIRYDESATDTERVTDAAGNEAASPDSSAIDDGTAPISTAATVNDVDGSGTFTLDDVIEVTFDEEVTFADGDSITIDDATADDAVITLAADCSGGDNTATHTGSGTTKMTLTLCGDASDGTDAEDIPADVTASSADGIEDVAGNDWDVAGSSDVTLEDSVAPTILSATFTDAAGDVDDFDAAGDEVALEYDEVMDDPSSGSVEIDGITYDCSTTDVDCALDGGDASIINVTHNTEDIVDIVGKDVQSGTTFTDVAGNASTGYPKTIIS